jgi:predicted MFS family arabinose efflux permease
MGSTTSAQAGPEAPPRLAMLALVLGPFALGYLISYLYRAINAVVAPNLVAELGLSAGELGFLTAAYLFAFAAFQLPLGVLLDRYGPRRVQAVLLTLAAVGAVGFALGRSATMLTLARALIGIGVAGGLMAGFKAVVLWVPAARRQLANALVMSFGAIGLVVSTAPAELAVQGLGWRTTFLVLAAATLGVGLLILLAVPERGSPATPPPLGQQFREIGRIYSDRAFLALAPLLAATAGAQIAIQTLWAGPWLRDVAGLGRSAVADQLMVMALAFLAGILLTGAIADRLLRRGVGVLDVMTAFIAVFIAAQATLLAGWTALSVPAWIVFGMLGQVAILAYPWLSSHFGTALSGRANTAMNLVIFLAAFLLQYAIGAVIDLFPPAAGGGYRPEAYRAAFGATLLLEIIALGWFLANRRRLSKIAA